MFPLSRICASSVIATIMLLGTQSAGGAARQGSSSSSAVGESSVRIPHLSNESTGQQARRPLAPGEVEIAQYGEPEDEGSFKDAGIQVVRFEPPFGAPYTITQVTFPSLTVNGVPAVFPSVRLCAADPATGLPLLSAPLFQIAPYTGRANGINEIPLNLAIPDSGETFYWCIEFPSKFSVDFPNDYPFIRMDAKDMERGDFGNSFEVTRTGGLGVPSPPRNLVASMTYRLSSEDLVPLETCSNLGANRIGSTIRFSYLRTPGRRAGGPSVSRTELLRRVTPQGHWQVWTSVAGRASSIDVDGLSLLGGIWAVRAVDQDGHASVASNVTYTAPFFITGGFGWDDDEPNGRVEEATELALPMQDFRQETIFPSGDRDYFRFQANPGDTVQASAYRVSTSGYNDLDLTLVLFDSAGRRIASDDNSLFNMNPRITYRVPQHGDSQQQEFTLEVADVGGSLLSPRSAPRAVSQPAYALFVGVVAGSAARTSNPRDAEGFGFRSASRNPAGSEARFSYHLPLGVAPEAVEVRVYDVHGRLVRTLLRQFGRAAGLNVVTWDGKDDQGRSVSSGTYYARISGGTFKAEQKIAILR